MAFVGRSRLSSLKLIAAAVLVLALVAIPALVARAYMTETLLVSRATGTSGAAANGNSGSGSATASHDVAMSGNGRYVAFVSDADNLNDADNDAVRNVYLRDTQTGTTTLVSRATGADGAGGDGDSSWPSVSPAGHFVAFQSTADNLSPDDDNSVTNVFVRDVQSGTTTLVSRTDGGLGGDGDSSRPSISAGGNFVAFQSEANNLSADDNDAFTNVFVRDMDAGTVAFISRGSAPLNTAADGNSFDPTIDGNGQRVAFASDADNLNAKDDNAFVNLFVRDVRTKFTSLVSRRTDSFLDTFPADGSSASPVLSRDGRYVVFTSEADNLSEEDDNSLVNVFRRDIQGSVTTLVSRATGAAGAPADAGSYAPAVSGDGHLVAFTSAATDLSAEDVAGYDVYVRDVSNDATLLLSRGSGASGPPATGSSIAPAISADGWFVAFLSEADSLSTEDDDTYWNVFKRGYPFGAAPPPPPVDLGSNDHSAHEAGAAGHSGHAGGAAGAGHAGHVTPTGGPGQTLVGPPVQDVDRLFVLAQVHADGKLVVTASVKLPGGRVSKLYKLKSFSRSVPAHRVYRVRLKLSKSGLKAVKRAVKRGKRVQATVIARAQLATGGPWSSVTRKIRLRD
jgi:Tol biopolymer transport system component